jgi:hypothetical protein
MVLCGLEVFYVCLSVGTFLLGDEGLWARLMGSVSGCEHTEKDGWRCKYLVDNGHIVLVLSSTRNLWSQVMLMGEVGRV